MRAQLIGFLLSLTPFAGLSAQSDYDLFVAEFQKAFEASSKSGMEKAVRAHPGAVLAHYEAVMLVWLQKRAEDGNRDLLDKMEEVFKEVTDSEALTHVRRFVEGQTPSRSKQMQSARTNYQVFMKEFDRVTRTGTRDEYLKLVDQGLELARYAEDVGHKAMAADTYSASATLLLRVPDHTLQDTIDAIDVARLFISCRETWDWTKDDYYDSWATVIIEKKAEVAAIQKAEEERAEAGLDTSAEGVAQFIDPAGEVLRSPLEFKNLKALPPDSNLVGGPLPLHWNSVVIEGQGNTAAMSKFKKREIYLVRTGASKVEVALDFEGKNTQRVNIASQVKPSLFYLGGGREDPYCMTFFISGDAEPFASTKMSMRPDPDQMVVYYRSLSSWEAKIAGEVITFYDDNVDGLIFTEDPMEPKLSTRLDGLGMKDDRQVVSYDSMKIGSRGPVVPFSNAVKIEDKWYMIELDDEGTGVVAKPLHADFFPTGTVKMKWSGSAAAKPQVLIIRGRDHMKTVAFNAAIAKGVEVPVGQYDIAYGRAVKGKGERTQMVSIFKGNSGTISVEAGQEAELAIGGPFKFDYVRGGTGDEVVLDSLDFRIVGIGGELYGKIQGPVPEVEVIVARTPEGKAAGVVGEFEPISSPEILNAAASTANEYLNARGGGYRGLGAEVAFFPVVKGDTAGNTVLKFKLPYEGALIGLRSKKNKLFGKIDPILK